MITVDKREPKEGSFFSGKKLGRYFCFLEILGGMRALMTTIAVGPKLPLQRTQSLFHQVCVFFFFIGYEKKNCALIEGFELEVHLVSCFVDLSDNGPFF